MDEREDIVMGESDSQTVIPVGSGRPSSASPVKRPLPGSLNGNMDPLPAPAAGGPLVSESPGQHPRSPHSTHESTPVLENQAFAQPKGVAKSVEVEDPSVDAMERDSIVEENSDWSEEETTAAKGLPLASLRTGLCYDIRMRYHCEVRPTADVHPEDPRRIYYIYKELCRAGLVDDPESSRPLATRTLQRIDVRNATPEELFLVHAPEHYNFVESTKGNICIL